MKSSSFGELLLLGALWGAAFMFMRVAVPEFGAVPMAATRIGLACLIMLVLVVALRDSLNFRTRWKTYLAVGAVNTAIPFVAYSFAAQHIPAGYSAIGNSTTPVWGALIAWLWFKEKLGPLKWLGIAFAFAGVLVLVGLQPVALTPLVIAGMLAVVLAAAMYATASFLIKRYLSDQSGFSGATGMVWGAAMWLVLPGLWFAPSKLPSLQAWGAVAALSLFCTVAGYALFFRLIRTIGPQRASSVAFLFPAFAAFWGWLILSEPITLNMIAGMAFVLVGTALVSMQSGGNLRTRLRDQLLLPILFALAPATLKQGIAQRVRGSDTLYGAQAAAAEQNLHSLIPAADAPAVIADARLTQLADHADLWLSRTRSDRWMAANLQVDSAEVPVAPALFVTFHFGGGWWLTRYLRTLGQRVSIVMRRGEPGPDWRGRIAHAMGMMRMRAIEKVCDSPLIMTDDGGTARTVLRTWKQGASVLGLVDLPPPLVDRTHTVRFFGRDAYFPPTLVELALRQGVPIYVYVGEWDAESLKPRLSIRRIDTTDRDAVFQTIISELEAAIRRRPGAWHAWGDSSLYFLPKP